MDGLIFHNDRILPMEEARLSPGQVGLLMGWGVFTTLRVYQGVPFALERHWTRLVRDAGHLAMNLEGYDLAGLRQAVVELVRANHRPESTARVSFIKNSGGLWSQAANCPPVDLLVFMREVTAWPASHRLFLQPAGLFSGGEFAGTKVLSWVRNAATLEKVHGQGYDDALLANEKEQLAECTSANIFLVRDGVVLTPTLHSGCLPGISREVLLEIAPATGIEIHEQDLTVEDLSSADEVFITSTTREVAAVGSIDPHWKYPTPGKVTSALARAFQAYVKAYLNKASA
jgi:branched-chain amino acid aminotransferase